MTDKPEIMTWAELGDWISKLTPEQQSMPVVVFNTETCDFASVSMAFSAAKKDAGQFIYSQPPGEVVEGQLILKIY